MMRCIGIAALGALLCLPAPAKAELLVNISKSQQRLSVTIDGAEAFRWPVSTGTRGHETPSGSFRPIRQERHWYSRQYSMTPMPWAVFFHRGYAVHGTMEAYNLGHAASHGCVRLRPDNASILYSLVRRQGLKNTKVVVLNGPLPATPGAAPMADADTAPNAQVQFTKALSGDDDGEVADFSAKTDTTAREITTPHKTRVASDEAQVLRERQAWLRGLDRKYGIAR
jgi:L,D-transpeptidase catalytic domain